MVDHVLIGGLKIACSRDRRLQEQGILRTWGHNISRPLWPCSWLESVKLIHQCAFCFCSLLNSPLSCILDPMFEFFRLYSFPPHTFFILFKLYHQTGPSRKNPKAFLVHSVTLSLVPLRFGGETRCWAISYWLTSEYAGGPCVWGYGAKPYFKSKDLSVPGYFSAKV